VSEDLERAVASALVWLKHHPERDYLDAAYGIAVWGRPFPDIGGKRWPEFVAAVKKACTNPPTSA
jgi:hypothetical protein